MRRFTKLMKMNGGQCRIRTCDLLLVSFPANVCFGVQEGHKQQKNNAYFSIALFLLAPASTCKPHKSALVCGEICGERFLHADEVLLTYATGRHKTTTA